MSKLHEELRQQKPFGSPAVEALLNLYRTAEHARAAETEVLAGHDLTSAQYNVLRILRGAGPAGHPCQEIGARMVSRVPDVTRLVDRLEARGFVARHRSDDDRRVVHVRILAPGLAALAELDAPMAALPERLFAALRPRELQTLNTLLEKARSAAV